MATKYGYDVGVDYSDLIRKDLEAQDYRAAAIHEAQRNEKIQGTGAAGKYPTTSHFADYLPRTDAVNAGMDALQGAGAFEYNMKDDPSWQAYRKQYLREADRQTRDTLAAYAGQTGGMPSTAAVSAAQQAGNYQRSQLTDKIPELYNAAYSRWLQGQENQRANLNLLHGIESDRANQSLTQQQWLWQQQQAEIERDDRLQQQALQNAMNRWAVLGQADEKVAAVLGVPVGTPTTDATYQQWSQQLAERQQTAAEQAQTWQQQQADLDRSDRLQQQTLQNQKDEKNDAYELVLKLVGMGLMPQDELLQAAGLSGYKASIKQMADKNAQLIAAGGAGGAGGSGGSRYSRDYSPPAVEPPASPPADTAKTENAWSQLKEDKYAGQAFKPGDSGVQPAGTELFFELASKYGYTKPGQLSTFGQTAWSRFLEERHYSQGSKTSLAISNPARWFANYYAGVDTRVSNNDIDLLKKMAAQKGIKI